MSVFGNSTQSFQFLKNLDERKLVDLCADLLTIDGHSEIKITDGPGDGQRDIHSKTGQGETYLTQSKYHGNPSITVSSKELLELVLGMVKHGYKRGLFITNAKISPQAKRECLNDFPGYLIEYIDGLELIKKVLGSLVLRALWYDGENINRVASVLVVPLSFRDLERDKSLSLLERDKEGQLDMVVQAGRTKLQVVLQRNTINISAFGLYRSPNTRTMGEGLSVSNLTEAILSGVIHVEDITDLIPLLARRLLEYVQVLYEGRKKHVALRVGAPYLTPLAGVSSGARIVLEEFAPFTLVQHNDQIMKEFDWLLPSANSAWTAPQRFSVSQAIWARWYHFKLGLCLDLTVISVPGDEERWSLQESREYTSKWWNQSLFVLFPSSAIVFLEEGGFPVPSMTYSWNENQKLLIWLHPNLSTTFRSTGIEPEDLPLKETKMEEPSVFNLDTVQVRDMFYRLRNKLESLDGLVVPPTKARYMIAFLDADPLPEITVCRYPSADLIAYPGSIPSPIDLSSRCFNVTVCWASKVTLPVDNDDYISNLCEVLSDLVKSRGLPLEVSAWMEEADITRRTCGSFVFFDFQYIKEVGCERTDSILYEIEQLVEPILGDIEDVLKPYFPDACKATKEYWNLEVGISWKGHSDS